jgi:hypothetical protein
MLFITASVPGIPYNVSVAAVNGAGVGQFSKLINFTKELGELTWLTMQRSILNIVNYIIVPDTPRDVSVMRSSATVMVVSWIPLNYTEARGFISHYTVTYSPMRNGRKRQGIDNMNQTVPGMDANTTRIERLDANTDYIVQVSATNGAGTSEPSLVIMATLPVEGKTTYQYCMQA